jgi:hypothetical protein
LHLSDDDKSIRRIPHDALLYHDTFCLIEGQCQVGGSSAISDVGHGDGGSYRADDYCTAVGRARLCLGATGDREVSEQK